MPISAQDYPRTWNEFLDWFSSEEGCLAYLERLRWPHGFACPGCGSMTAPYRSSRIRLRCILKDSDDSVLPFVQESVEPGARVRTDGSAAYRSLKELG